MREGQNLWEIDLANSEIAFDALEKEKSFEGRFSRFDLGVDLDLSQPETGSIMAVIDLTSVDAGNADRNKVLGDPEMFFVREFPTATFQSKNIIRLAPDKYEAQGELSIKGVSRNIVLPFTILQSEENAVVTAIYEMNRLDFNVGTGSFMSNKFIGYPVTVHIKIIARKADVEKGSQ